MNNLLHYGLSGWTPEETSLTNEMLINGKLIDWDCWARNKKIAPQQAALLAYYFDPLKWRSYKSESSFKINNKLRDKVTALKKWLERRSKKWTLTELILALKEYKHYDTQPPYGMIQAVEPNPPETLMRKEARLSAAQTLGLDVSKNTHYFFPAALRANRIARLQCPFDKAGQSEFTRQIETTLNRSNPESDYHATYSAAHVIRLLRMEPYQMPSEHIRAWYNATLGD